MHWWMRKPYRFYRQEVLAAKTMSIRELSETELAGMGIKSMAVGSLELDGMTYTWAAAYPRVEQQQIQQHCQALRAEGRAVLLVSHRGDKVSVWQGAAGKAAPPVPAGSRTVTMRYRGRTVTKILRDPAPNSRDR